MLIKKYIRIIGILWIIVVTHCSDSTTDPRENILPDGVAGFTKFNYALINTAPYHTQSSMLSGYLNRLYRFGSKAPVQILDLTANLWSEIALPDSTFWRWDGAAVTIADSIFVVAVSTASDSYDILKLNSITNSIEHTLIDLPDYFHYPAYCVNENKIVFFSLMCDSVLGYNASNGTLLNTVANPFHNFEDINLTLSSGKYLNYFYVFGGYASLSKNLFYRLNLDNFQWEGLYIPPNLEKKKLIGSSFGEHFLLFCDSVSTYDYSFLDNKWYLDTSKVPIYVRDLTGHLTQGEWSFFAEDSCLYGTENLSDKVWRITK